MALSMDSLTQIPISFASCSIGCKDEHTLPKRLDAISGAGFGGIELSMPDLVAFASQHLRTEVGSDDYPSLCTAAKVVKAMCAAKKLKIMMLQPFSNFEGWPPGSPGRREAFDRARGWIDIMRAAGTDLLQVGSTDTPADELDLSTQTVVSDLRELGKMLAEHNFRMAYENWCWSSHAPDWLDVWNIVKEVDLPNVGLCLDTFQSGGGEWGDPTTESGKREDVSDNELNVRFQKSLQKLSEMVPPQKIYLLQVSDAYKLDKPFPDKTDENGLRPRGRWSHDYRPLPFAGGYLPVKEFTQAVLQTGFRGWFSYEVFDSGRDGKGRDYELDEYAEEAEKCHRRLLKECCDE